MPGLISVCTTCPVPSPTVCPRFALAATRLLGTSEWRPQFQVSKVFQLLDNLSWIRGNHSFKFGFEYKRAANDYLDIKAPNGRYIVPGSSYVGDGVANLLLGTVGRIETTSASRTRDLHRRFHVLPAGFLQGH